jgi:hypothetical protein
LKFLNELAAIMIGTSNSLLYCSRPSFSSSRHWAW